MPMRRPRPASWAFCWLALAQTAASGPAQTVGEDRLLRSEASWSHRHWWFGRTRTSQASPQTRRRRLDESGNDYQLYGEDGGVNEVCTEYLLDFLEGASDAKDTCQGVENAYKGASCQSGSFYTYQAADDDHDDYFSDFADNRCCQSLLNFHTDYCEENRLLTNMHLLFVSLALLLCEVAKSLLKRWQVKVLPEPAVCILVGISIGALADMAPGMDVDSVSFDEELFLSVLLPPIIFEAALKVDKAQFRRRRLAIFLFAVLGTIMSTFITGYMVHFSSRLLPNTTSLPQIDSMLFGALISSIDPVAILSVLSSLNLDETDTVFIVVLGESLLNDGVAITISHVLIERFTDRETLNMDGLLDTMADFLIVGFGSIAIGVVCSFLSVVYFWVFRGLLNPAMEVGSFFLCALIPYWTCDGIGLSGIVAIVAAGFIMDIYIASNHSEETVKTRHLTGQARTILAATPPGRPLFLRGRAVATPRQDSDSSFYTGRDACGARHIADMNVWALLEKNEKVRLSGKANQHVRFVAHLLSQLAENAIFLYLGLFLFSQQYDWDVPLMAVSVVSCVTARAIMVVTCCTLVWQINVFRQRQGRGHMEDISRTAVHLTNGRTQLVLVFAGLRGAVSLALVENVPMYNNITGEGCEFKPVLKAMTSASIIFTIFVLGGSAYYVFPLLGIGPDDTDAASDPQSGDTTIKQTGTELAPYHGYKEPLEVSHPHPPPVV